jgi:hypothetical protein
LRPKAMDTAVFLKPLKLWAKINHSFLKLFMWSILSQQWTANTPL